MDAASNTLPSAVACAVRTAPVRSIIWKIPLPAVFPTTTICSPERMAKRLYSPVALVSFSSIGVGHADEFDLVGGSTVNERAAHAQRARIVCGKIQLGARARIRPHR